MMRCNVSEKIDRALFDAYMIDDDYGGGEYSIFVRDQLPQLIDSAVKFNESGLTLKHIEFDQEEDMIHFLLRWS